MLEESLLSDISIPGAQTSLNFCKEFASLDADRLNARTYVFGNRGESKSQFQGLQTHGPLSSISQPPNLLFIFRERDRHAARDLATAIKGSNPRTRGRFYGFSSLFKTDITIDPNPVVLVDYSTAEMTRALEAVKKKPLALPILVMPQDEQAYLNHKAIFTHAMVPTQVCTLEVIQDESSLKWSVGNIALQVFCKAGGIPWKVRTDN